MEYEDDYTDEPETILLKDTNGFELETHVAGAELLPGMFADVNVDGELEPAATGSTHSQIVLANKTWGKTIDDAIVAGENAKIVHLGANEGRYAYARLADGEAVTQGDDLVYDAGAVRAAAGDGSESDSIAPIEAIEDADSAADDDFVRVKATL